MPIMKYMNDTQGRIQDLSKGGGQDFLGTEKFIIRGAGENFFLT